MKRNHALAVQPMASGLKCDRPGCGYTQTGPVLDLKSITSLIGTPCPKCGANLLTKEDARIVLVMMRIFSVINFVFLPLTILQQIAHWFGWKRPKDAMMRVKTNGTGTVKCSIEKEDKQ